LVITVHFGTDFLGGEQGALREDIAVSCPVRQFNALADAGELYGVLAHNVAAAQGMVIRLGA
jgi:hypothetical protein